MKANGTQKFSIFKYKKIIMLALILVAIVIIVAAAYITDYTANTVTREEVLTIEPKGEYRSSDDFLKNFKTFEIAIDDNRGLITPHTDTNGNLIPGYFKFRIKSELVEETNLKNTVTVYGGLGANWIKFISNTGKVSFTPGSINTTFKVDGIETTFPTQGHLLFIEVDYPTLYVLVEWQELTSYYYTYLEYTPDQYLK